jgi:hypothetical protein
MASREYINQGGTKSICFNVTSDVGPDCSNQPGDVRIVKAMFAYIARFMPERLRAGGIDEAAVAAWKPDGECGSDLGQTILAYQQMYYPQKVLAADGVISMARYMGRHIQGGEQRVMTIHRLHFDCEDAHFISPLGTAFQEYTMALLGLYPQIAGYTDLVKFEQQ